jgi:hypothetical protein
MNSKVKTCNLCDTEQPLSKFSKHGNGKLNAQCKTCVKQRYYRRKELLITLNTDLRPLATEYYFSEYDSSNSVNCPICNRPKVLGKPCTKCVQKITTELENEAISRKV